VLFGNTNDPPAPRLANQLWLNYPIFIKTHEKPAVKIMAIVLGLFLFCHGLFLRCCFVHILNDHRPCNDLEYKLPIAVNPLVYAILKRDIKETSLKDYCLSVTNSSNDELIKKIELNKARN